MNKRFITILMIATFITTSAFAFTSKTVDSAKLEQQLDRRMYSDYYNTSSLVMGLSSSPFSSSDNNDFQWGLESALYKYYGLGNFGTVNKVAILFEDKNQYASLNLTSGINFRFNYNESVDYNIGLAPQINYYIDINQTSESVEKTRLFYLGGELSANVRYYVFESSPEFSLNSGLRASYAKRLYFNSSEDFETDRFQVQFSIGFTYAFYGSQLKSTKTEITK